MDVRQTRQADAVGFRPRLPALSEADHEASIDLHGQIAPPARGRQKQVEM